MLPPPPRPVAALYVNLEGGNLGVSEAEQHLVPNSMMVAHDAIQWAVDLLTRRWDFLSEVKMGYDVIFFGHSSSTCLQHPDYSSELFCTRNPNDINDQPAVVDLDCRPTCCVSPADAAVSWKAMTHNLGEDAANVFQRELFSKVRFFF